MLNAMNDKKIVLISESGYNSEHDNFLNNLLDEGCELFCVVGKDCALWEDVMDEIAIGDGNNNRFITTTSHTDETEQEVIEFANNWTTKSPSGVKVVRI